MPYILAIIASVSLFIIMIVDDRIEKGIFEKEKAKWAILVLALIGIGCIMGVMYILI